MAFIAYFSRFHSLKYHRSKKTAKEAEEKSGNDVIIASWPG